MSLDAYDPLTQRSTGAVKALTLGPASELIAPDGEAVEREVGAEHRLPLAYASLRTVFDLSPGSPLIAEVTVGERAQGAGRAGRGGLAHQHRLCRRIARACAGADPPVPVRRGARGRAGRRAGVRVEPGARGPRSPLRRGRQSGRAPSPRRSRRRSRRALAWCSPVSRTSFGPCPGRWSAAWSSRRPRPAPGRRRCGARAWSRWRPTSPPGSRTGPRASWSSPLPMCWAAGQRRGAGAPPRC